MDARDFELRVSLPADARFAEAMRELAAHAARYAGCQTAEADRYGAAVEGVALTCLGGAAAGQAVSVIVRRGAGPVEFLIACHGRVESSAVHDAQIVIDVTREHGGPMCRVARLMPRP